MSTQRERRLFEALYALAKAAEAVLTDEGDILQVLDNLEAALVEANEALAYRDQSQQLPGGEDGNACNGVVLTFVGKGTVE